MKFLKIKENLDTEKESNHDVQEQRVNNKLFPKDSKKDLEDKNNLLMIY